MDRDKAAFRRIVIRNTGSSAESRLSFTASSQSWNASTGGGSILDYVDLQGSLILISGTAPRISNSSISNNASDAIWIEGGTSQVINCVFRGSGRPILIFSGSPLIQGNTFEDNQEALYITSGAATPVIDGNLIDRKSVV